MTDDSGSGSDDSGEFDPTFKTRDGEQLDRSNWRRYRNGPQSSFDPGKQVSITISYATRDRLQQHVTLEESYDEVLNRWMNKIERDQEREEDSDGE